MLNEECLPALPIPHCPVMLVLDTSHSMWGRGMQDQQDALRAFHKTMLAHEFSGSRIEIAAVGMGDNLKVLQPFAPLAKSNISELAIRPNGDTPVGGALRLALDELHRRTEELHRTGDDIATPQLIILSDGKSSDDFIAEAAEIRRGTAAGRLVCRAVAIGENPDLTALARIAGENVSRPDYGKLRETFAQIGEKVSQTYEDAVPEILMAEANQTSSEIGNVRSNTSSAAGRLSGRTILVDGTNVCFWGRYESSPSIAPILTLAQALDAEGADWQICFDASTRHHLAKSGMGDEVAYENLLRRRSERFTEMPGGSCADVFLLGAAAADPKTIIVTNDLFRDHAEQYPFVREKKRLIRGSVFHDQLCIPKLGICRALIQTSAETDAKKPEWEKKNKFAWKNRREDPYLE